MSYLDDALGDCGCSSQLGDIICTPSEAQAGEDAMKRLRNVFASIGSPARWKPYVDDLERRWKEYDDRWWKSVAWCDAKQIGVEAQALLQRIAAESGGQVAPAPAADPQLNPGASSKVPELGTIVAVGALALGAAIVLKNR